MTQQRGGESESLAGKGGERAAQTPGSASNIAQHFRGINFPASKQDLMRHAEQNSAPTDVQNIVRGLPERTYNSMADVMAAWGQERR